ncbi:5'-nucleotidase, partial [Thiohalorhabdus sp. Cl-TMA]
MPVDLSETLVIGISATALFDLSETDRIFQLKKEEDPETAVAEYRAYMWGGPIPLDSQQALRSKRALGAPQASV